MITRFDTEIDITQYYLADLPTYYNQFRLVNLPYVPKVSGDIFAIIRQVYGNGCYPAGTDVSKFDWMYGDTYLYNLPYKLEQARYILYVIKLDEEGRARVDITGSKTYLMGYIHGTEAKYLYQDEDPTVWYDGDEYGNPDVEDACAETRTGIEGVSDVPEGAIVAVTMSHPVKNVILVNSTNYTVGGTYYMLAVDEKVYRDDIPLPHSVALHNDDIKVDYRGIIFAVTDIYSSQNNNSLIPYFIYYQWGRSAKYLGYRNSPIAGLTPIMDDDNEENMQFMVPNEDGSMYLGGSMYESLSPVVMFNTGFVALHWAVVKVAEMSVQAVEAAEHNPMKIGGATVPKGDHYNVTFFSVEDFDRIPINLNELEFRLSGGVDNISLSASLGGAISDTVAEATNGILISSISQEQEGRGARLCTCLYMLNTSQFDAIGITLFVERDNTPNADVLMAIGYSEVGGYEPIVPSQESLLDGLTLKAAYQEHSGLRLPVIPSGGHIALWLVVDLHTGVSYNNESFRLVVTQRE